VPQIVLPKKMPSYEELAKQREEEAKAAALAVAKSKEESQSLERILLGGAFASLIISLSLLLIAKGGVEGVVKYFSPSQPEVKPEISPKVDPDAQFADYMERSLDLLNKQTKTTGNNQPSALPSVPAPPPASELPKVPVEASPTQNLSSILLPLNRIADLIEAQAARPPLTIPPAQVVLIPPSPQPVPVVVTYNPPPAPAPVAQPKPAPAPVTQSQPQAKPAPAPVAQSQPQTKPAPAPVAQSQPEAQPKDKVQEQAQQPNVVPLPPPPPVMAPDQVSLRTIPNYTHTLVGVLELGDRSAALFEINGVARRIYVGESIGASGWMLVKVAEGEATMRRNGEIRSVFVGEQF